MQIIENYGTVPVLTVVEAIDNLDAYLENFIECIQEGFNGEFGHMVTGGI